MSRLFSIGIVFVLVMAVVAGCAVSSNEGGSQGAGEGSTEELTFTMSHAYPPGDFRAKGFAYFAEEVEKRTNGEVKIVIHPSQSLVKLQDSYEAITTGTVDMTALPTSYITNRIKDLAILDVPGSFNPEHWIEMEKELYPIFVDIFKEHNIVPILPSYESFTGILLREGAEPVTDPNLQGYKIRDLGKWPAEGLKSWKATPINIPLSDLSVAVQNKTVDGVYINWPLIKALKLYEMTPNITYTGFNCLWLPIGMNMDSYNKLSDEHKKVFEEVKWEAMEMMEEAGKPELEALNKEILAAGGKIHTLTPEQKQAFIDAEKSVFEAVEQEAGPNGKKLIEALKKFQ